MVNPFPNKPFWVLRVCSTSLLKTMLEKEKLLVMSNFSFFHSLFYLFREFSVLAIKFEIVVSKLLQLGRAYNLSFGKGLKRFQQVICHLIGFIDKTNDRIAESAEQDQTVHM